MAAATNTNLDCLADSAVTSGCVSHPTMFLVLLLSGSWTAAAGSLESLAIRWVHTQCWARYPAMKQHFPLKRKIEFSGASYWTFLSESQGWETTKPQLHYPTPLLAVQFELNCLSLTTWGPKQGEQSHWPQKRDMQNLSACCCLSCRTGKHQCTDPASPKASHSSSSSASLSHLYGL